MTHAGLLFNLTLVLYLVSSVAYHVLLFAGSERARTVAAAALLGGVLCHTAAIGVFCSSGGSVLHGPMPFALVSYFLAVGQTAANLRRAWSAVGALSVPLAFIAEFYARSREGGVVAAASQPAGLLRPHVMVLLLGFTAFALAFCLAVIYLIQARLLKTKRIRGLFRRLPPLEGVSTAAHWLAIIGFSMLTFGIVTGAIVAQAQWGAHWILDPRTLISMVAWIIYAAYLGVSMVMGWRGRRTTYFLIAGFLVVLVAFFASIKPHRTLLHPATMAAGTGVRA